MLPILGLCYMLATYVHNAHEMSIKPVRAARITDTTDALLDESRVLRHPRNTVKHDVFEHPTQKTWQIHIHPSTGFDRGSTRGRRGVYTRYTRLNKRVGGRGGERI